MTEIKEKIRGKKEEEKNSKENNNKKIINLIVVLPTPDGPEITIRFIIFLCLVAIILNYNFSPKFKNFC